MKSIVVALSISSLLLPNTIAFAGGHEAGGSALPVAPAPHAVELVRTISEEGASLGTCRFLNDHELEVSGYANGSAVNFVWDTVQGKKVREAPRDQTTSMISADGRIGMRGSFSGGQAQAYHVATGTPIQMVDKPFAKLQYRPAFSPNGEMVVAQGEWKGNQPNQRGYVLTLYRNNGALLKELGGVGVSDQYLFSPDNRQIAVGYNNPPEVSIYNAESGQERKFPALATVLRAGVKSMQFSPDGKHLVVLTNRLLVLNAETGAVEFDYLPIIKGKESAPSIVHFSPKGDKLFWGAYGTPYPQDYGAETIDFPPAQGARPVRLSGLGISNFCFAFSPDGKYLATNAVSSNGQPISSEVHIVPVARAHDAINEDFLKAREAEKKRVMDERMAASSALQSRLQSEGKDLKFAGCVRIFNQGYPVHFSDDNNSQHYGARVSERRGERGLELLLSVNNGVMPVQFTAATARTEGDYKIYEGEGTQHTPPLPTRSVKVIHKIDEKTGRTETILMSGPSPQPGQPGGKEYGITRFDNQGNWNEMKVSVRPNKTTAYRVETTCGNGFGEAVAGRWKNLDDHPAAPVPPLAPRNTDIDRGQTAAISNEAYLRARREHLARETAYNDLLEKFPTPQAYRTSDDYKQRLAFLSSLIPTLPEAK